MRLEYPLALALLMFLPLFLEEGLLGKLFSRKREGVSFASSIPVQELKAHGLAKWRAPLLSILFTFAYSSLVVALARPQYGNTYSEVTSSGRDIMLVLDVSPSMEALDFSLGGKRVNRLTALQAVVTEFIKKRSGDRMGLVVFGGMAFTQCPLTTDQSILADFVSRLETEMAGTGTAIGDALTIALKRVRDIDSDSKVLVLVTDGKNNSGQVDPLSAATVAQELGIKIYSIGIGQDGPAPFPVRGLFGQTRYVNQPMEFDEETLKKIAETTGGLYFNATNTTRLIQIYDEIDRLEKRSEDTPQYVEWEEHFLPFLLTGLTLWFLAELLSVTAFLRVP